MESVKDLVALVNGDTRTAVVNREHESMRHDLHRHTHAPSGPGKLAGVVDKHADQPVDGLRVGTYGRRNCRTGELERDAVA
jgi:hypothetical protein